MDLLPKDVVVIVAENLTSPEDLKAFRISCSNVRNSIDSSYLMTELILEKLFRRHPYVNILITRDNNDEVSIRRISKTFTLWHNENNVLSIHMSDKLSIPYTLLKSCSKLLFFGLRKTLTEYTMCVIKQHFTQQYSIKKIEFSK